MKTRREFLAAAPAGILAASALLDAAAEPRGVRVGCQTNAWRIDPNDFNQVLAVLRQLKTLGFETGFRNVQGQFANAAPARKQIEQTGLQFSPRISSWTSTIRKRRSRRWSWFGTSRTAPSRSARSD